MAGLVDIANGTLQRIGEPPIGALEDGNERARALARALPVVRDRVLETNLFAFARWQASLPALAEKPLQRFERQFRLPLDFISLIAVHAYGRTERHETLLLADAPAPLSITYVRRVEAPELWSPLFAELVELAAALRVAPAIKGAAYDTRDLLAEYERRLGQAKGAGARQEQPIELAPTDWELVRL